MKYANVIHVVTNAFLGKLDVLETRTCDEIDKLAKRLDLAYRVVQTL